VLVVRERRYFWSSRPGNALLLSTVATLTVFTFMGAYGIFVPALAAYQVLIVLGISAIFMLGIDFPKYYLFRRFGL
jgi:H+-transporting ATPase